VKLGFAAFLLLAASMHAQAETVSQTAAGNDCRTVSGIINMSADNGEMLWAGQTRYQVNDGPEALKRRLDSNIQTIVDGADGTFMVCPTGARDRFGDGVINILSFANLTLLKPPN
jgi:hypothetical protein